MRGYADGQDSARKDDSGQFPVQYTATNGAFRKIAQLDAAAPSNVKIDGDEYIRNDKGLHVGPELAAV